MPDDATGPESQEPGQESGLAPDLQDRTSKLQALRTQEEGATEPAPAEPTEPTEPTATEPTEPTATESIEAAPAKQSRQLMEAFDRIYGHQESRKYGSDAAFLQGMSEKIRMLGQRDQDAEYGRQMRQYEEPFSQYLEGQQGQGQLQGQAPSGGYSAPELREIRRLQEQASRTPESLSPVDRRKLEDAAERMTEASYNLAYQPENIIDPLIERRLGKIQEQAQQTAHQAVAQQQAVAQEQAFISKFESDNANWMYRGGKPANTPDEAWGQLTEEGHKFIQYAQAETQRNRSNAEAVHYARLQVMADRMANSKPAPAPVDPRAHHQPAVATPPQPSKNEQEAEYKKMVNNFTLAEHLEYEDRMARAAGKVE